MRNKSCWINTLAILLLTGKILRLFIIIAYSSDLCINMLLIFLPSLCFTVLLEIMFKKSSLHSYPCFMVCFGEKAN